MINIYVYKWEEFYKMDMTEMGRYYNIDLGAMSPYSHNTESEYANENMYT